jgi:hypothetical protein
MTQPNAPEAVKSFPAYLTRGLSMVMLLVFVAVFMTVGYSNRAETIVWVIFALFHVAAAMYISFKGASRFWILISTLCMSIVLIYSIVTVGLASQHLPNSSSASPGTSSSSSMHGVSALVHCVSISFFAFAGFIWNCTMWYYLRVHADAADISEQDIDDSTETFGSSFFPAKPLLFISGAILFVAVLQIILGGLAANQIGAVVRSHIYYISKSQFLTWCYFFQPSLCRGGAAASPCSRGAAWQCFSLSLKRKTSSYASVSL